MEDTGRDSRELEDQVKQKQIGAVRIYDGALNDDFCNDLIEVFEGNSELHLELEDERLKCRQYGYSKNHADEEVHENLKEHIMTLYDHYLKDLNLPNMIAQKGLESLIIRKYEPDYYSKWESI